MNRKDLEWRNENNKGYQSTTWLLLLTGSVLFSCLLIVLSGATSPVSAALILSVDNGDEPVISVTDIRNREIGFLRFRDHGVEERNRLLAVRSPIR